MSVILTAGRKAVRAKNKKKTPKKRPNVTQEEHVYEPPISTPKTVVWFWILDEVPTTVMYTKDKNEVWCNGSILHTETHFIKEDGQGIEVRFLVGHKERPATIVKSTMQGSGPRAMTHQLYVDNKLIQENMGQPPEDSETNLLRGSVYGAHFGGTSWEQPPSYDDVMRPMDQFDKKNQ